MSRSLLVHRLHQLEAAGLVERRRVGKDGHPEYHLTEGGEELRPIIFQLGFWGKRWVQREVSREELDAGLLMWDVQRRILRDRLPRNRVVVLFRFTDAPRGQQDYWLLLDHGEVDLCLKDPGCEENLCVRTDVRTLTEVWLGDRSLTRVLDEQALTLRGPLELRRAFPDWLGLSVFATMAHGDGDQFQAGVARGTAA